MPLANRYIVSGQVYQVTCRMVGEGAPAGGVRGWRVADGEAFFQMVVTRSAWLADHYNFVSF